MEFRLQRAAINPAEINGEQAKHVGADDIQRDRQPFAVAREVERLQSVTGKRGVSAAKADHEKITPFGLEPRAPCRRAADGGDHTDGEAAAYIYKKRAERKNDCPWIMLRLMLGDHAVEAVPGQRAELSSKNEQQQSEHVILCAVV